MLSLFVPIPRDGAVVNSAYSDLKAAWHLDKIEAMRKGHQVVPAQVQLILSDLCNQDCP